MPIQWYRQPDGTWILWNTEESQAQPMEVAPSAQGGGVGLRGTDTSDVAAQMFEQMGERASQPSKHETWGKPTREDRKFLRDAVKQFHGGQLTPTESAKLSEQLADKGLVDVTEDGVWSKASLGHDYEQVMSFITSMEKWREDATGALSDRGYDTSGASIDDIMNYLRKEGLNLYQGETNGGTTK